MLFVSADRNNGTFDITDTSDGVVENINRETLIHLVKNGVRIYGVSNNYRVKAFRNEHDIIKQYQLQCELSGIAAPKFSVERVGTVSNIVLSRVGVDYATSFNVPEFVTVIGEKAFSGCSILADVTLPDGLIRIEDYAFENCYSIKDISIPETVTHIGKGAFSHCRELEQIVIPNSITELSDRIFYRSVGLEKVVLPETLTSIGEYAFSTCVKLPELVIPDSVKEIHQRAFEFCTSLASVKLPKELVRIRDMVFWNCSSLKRLNIPRSVIGISVQAFKDCSKLIVSCEEGSYAETYCKNNLIQYSIGETD